MPRRHIPFTVALFALIATGCAQKLTHDRWETIHNGASPDVVEATLGEPWERMDNQWIYHDEDRGITANVYFDERGVIGKKWADPDRGIEGSNPNVNEPGESEETRVRKME
jgi:hypothetical protein